MGEQSSVFDIRPSTLISGLGRLSLMLGRALLAFKYFFSSIHLIVAQMYQIGVRSVWLIVITSIFTGGVSAWQAAYQFQNYVPIRYLGGAVGKAVLIELAPVLTALVIAGRVGAGIAAELGSMKVTEQIDAMESMSVDPIRYLVMPRFAAGIFMLPVITALADFIAIFGALTVAVSLVGVETETFMNGFKQFFTLSDFYSGLIKAAVFGGIISIMGCYHGFFTTGGAQGVGASTTRAVVSSAVMILIADYVMATILFRI
jgi:phospholipid/cholesterol/gamma-HCH transport system permease protein